MSEVGSVTALPVSIDLLLPLLVATPIVASAVLVALGQRFDRVGWPVTLATCLGLFGAVATVASTVFVSGERVAHALGGFPRRYGIELVVDEFSAVFALLVAGLSLAVLAYTRVGGPRGTTFYAGYLLLVAGLLGITVTGDVFNLFVFLEITGIATYALVATGDDAEAAVAALKYLILGTVAASLYLLGVGLVFIATGTLNMVELSRAIQALDAQGLALARAAVAFVVVGFAIKVAQWPVHTWQPDAYQRAPDGVTVLIASLVSTVYAYALGRVLFTVFGVEFLASTPYLQAVLLTLGCASVVAGSLLAATQRDVKRLFAYSSVSQFGLVIAAYGLLTETAFVGAVYHLVGHGLVKAGLFAAVGAIAASTGTRRLREYAGLAGRRPVASAGIAVLGISLVGIPPTIGFVGKWYIALGAVEAQQWPVAAIVFLSTMFTLLYVARLLELLYFTPAPSGVRDAPSGAAHDESPAVATDGGGRGASIGMLAVVVTAAALAVALGFAGGAFYGLLDPFLTEVFASG